jgi:hypothetical protein
MSKLRMVYLALAVWGAIHPMLWYVEWFRQNNGSGIGQMIQAWHANAATVGLALDMFIAAITLTVWILAEVYARKNWSALLAIPASFLIGVSCGLPLYLFLRTRPIT